MERTKYDKEIKTPFMFGWTKCECCGNEFRFERMYRFKTLSFWKAYTYRYGCKKCFNDKEDFYKYMVKKDTDVSGIIKKETYIEGGEKREMHTEIPSGAVVSSKDGVLDEYSTPYSNTVVDGHVTKPILKGLWDLEDIAKQAPKAYYKPEPFDESKLEHRYIVDPYVYDIETGKIILYSELMERERGAGENEKESERESDGEDK